MDVAQLRRLRPELTKFLGLFDDCFAAQGHPRPPAGVRLRPALRRPREERRADRHQRRRAGQDPPGVPQPARTGTTTCARPAPAHRPRRARRAPLHRRSSTRPATSRRGTRPPASSGSGAASSARPRTASSRSTSAYARDGFHCLLDGELYLPESWSDDRDRCREAGIPDDMVYRPKWKIALELYDRATGNGLHFDWMTFDEGYGSKPDFLRELSARGSAVRRRGAAELHGLAQAAAGRDPAVPQDTAGGAAARPRGWPAAARRRDGSTRCSNGTGFATSPGSGGGSRTGTKGRWSGRSSTCGSTPGARTACRASRCT